MKKPEVIMIGDSISMGYRPHVASILSDCCRVIYSPDNNETASRTYRMLYDLYHQCGGKNNNVRYVYWNNGLWDVVRIFGEEPQETIEEYTGYLNRIFLMLKKLYPAAHICFATTTPVVEDRYDDIFSRRNSDIEKYNLAAMEVLQGKVDGFDDLFLFMENTVADDYIDATHFRSDKYRMIAAHISKSIRDKLKDEIDEYLLEREKANEQTDLILDQIAEKNYGGNVAVWGAGKTCKTYIGFFSEYCRIGNVVDRDKSLVGSIIKNRKCMSVETIKGSVDFVIVAIENDTVSSEVEEACVNMGVACCSYRVMVNKLLPDYMRKCLKGKDQFNDIDPFAENDMVKYIGFDVPVNVCNFSCSYCYIHRTPQNYHFDNVYYDPRFIRMKLSREKVGGSALIGLTAFGETLLDPLFTDLCLELLKEGHYLHIVTNGILGEKIKELLEKAGDYSRHIIFKLSFHYIQLKHRKLLDRFAENTRMIENSQASYTVEIVPHDELVEFIPEIKQFSLSHFGAYPQVTIPRDVSRGLKLQSDMSFEQFVKTWKVFDSELFNMRIPLYMERGINCDAGKKSFFLNLETGDIRRCAFGERAGNLYFDRDLSIDFLRVGNTCPLEYCSNCHVYASLGVLPKKNLPTYMEIRDRVKPDGCHWIKDDMRRFLDTKL